MRRTLSYILTLCLLLTSFTSANSQALPSRVSAAVAGVIERSFMRTGVAANDPRMGATLTAVGVAANDGIFVVASTLGMVAAGVAGLPVWATVAIGAGVGALAFGAYQLLTSNSLGGVSVVLPPTNVLSSTATIGVLPGNVLSGQPYYAENGQLVYPQVPFVIAAGALAGGWYFSGTLTPCLPGTLLCARVEQTTVPGQTVSGTLEQVIQSIPPEAMNQPMSPSTLADLSNALLQRAAAQPGYQGLPVSLSQPVTLQDAMDWSNLNPTMVPTPSDITLPLPVGVVMPLPTGSVVPPPYPLPPPYPYPTPSPPPPTTPDVFLPPGMEATPTASQILAPILGLLPDFRSYVTPAHTSVCPAPSVNLFEKHLVLDAHCTLLDSPAVRQVLQAVMFAVWTIVAIFIILGA